MNDNFENQLNKLFNDWIKTQAKWNCSEMMNKENEESRMGSYLITFYLRKKINRNIVKRNYNSQLYEFLNWDFQLNISRIKLLFQPLLCLE